MRCPVCGWADADTLHALLHIYGELTKLTRRVEKLEAELAQRTLTES